MSANRMRQSVADNDTSLVQSQHNWQINQIDIENAKAEIKYYFNKNSTAISAEQANEGLTSIKLDEDLFISYAKIEAFLMDTKAVVRQLQKLNNLIACRSEKPSIKGFREIVEKEIARFGFYPKLAKILGNLPGPSFRALVANGLLSKDVAVGEPGHGEFTHTIQWLMIAWQNEETNFLDQPVIDIFKRIGHDNAVYLREFSPNYVLEIGLWDLLVDRDERRHGWRNDFRYPDYLEKFLLDEGTTFNLDLLSSLLIKREDKRREQFSGELSKEKFLHEKYTNPSRFYHKGNIPLVHEPLGSKINFEDFELGLKNQSL